MTFQSDATAFFQTIGAQLVGALTVRVGDRRLAEDLASEAIARAWADWPRVSMMANPTGWVFQVGFNLASSHWRRQVVRRRIEATRRREGIGQRRDDVAHAPCPAEALVIREAIGRLSDRQQRVVILRYFVGMTIEETAEVLGVTSGTVKTLTSRAMSRLRVSLDRDADD